ncbi:MAG: nucleoside triphosphate pyrophosphohydrolase [Alphaproteobacteria bacterium]|nr:nucleoside triphosphate pyrophosphohydrolase [Alphaproteobacteria bacterium]
MTVTPSPISRLLAIMESLRAPESGCPWDREQTFSSIAPYTIEEAYEVAEAIRGGNVREIRDEIGDLLFQVVFYAQIAAEAGAFTFDDVANAIADKMVRRHPHVFSDLASGSADAQTLNWERIKAYERSSQRTASDTAPSALDGVALALPGLSRAAKLQSRAARVGFDWPEASLILAKIVEETEELRAAMAAPNDQGHIAEELGDLLFACVNLVRHLKVDPEAAMRSANAKFERRFRAIEVELAKGNRRPDQATLAEMDRLWDSIKADEAARATLDKQGEK